VYPKEADNEATGHEPNNKPACMPHNQFGPERGRNFGWVTELVDGRRFRFNPRQASVRVPVDGVKEGAAQLLSDIG
jgi:hypothetical protein